MILRQHVNGTELAVLDEPFLPQLGDTLTVNGHRYLVHWIKHTRAGVELGVEDITPSGGCGG